MKTQLLIPAAGPGARLGAEGPKALVDLAGRPILARALERFAPFNLISGAVVVVPKEWRARFEAALALAFPSVPFTLVDGGAVRQESVSNGLAALDPETEIVVIHDAARPFVSEQAIRSAIEAAAAEGAATVAVPSVDTILESDDAGYLASTPERGRLWACQTPQAFRVETIRVAHAAARHAGYTGTDDASLVQRNGGKVKLVEGAAFNRKITTPEDLVFAQWVVREGLFGIDAK